MKHLDTYKQKVLNTELLEYSAKKSSLQTIRELISKGADVNCKSHTGETPLMKASKVMFYNAVKLFIENGADVNAVTLSNHNALIRLAASIPVYSFDKKQSPKKIVDLLVTSGIDLTVKDKINNIDAFELNPAIGEYVMSKFPKECEEYIMKKDSEKYNI